MSSYKLSNQLYQRFYINLKIELLLKDLNTIAVDDEAVPEENIAKGTTDPRVEFILPKSYHKFKRKS